MLVRSDEKIRWFVFELNYIFTPLGKFYFVNKNERIEQSVKAHQCATIYIRLSVGETQFAIGKL